jgi:hypothetical protein
VSLVSPERPHKALRGQLILEVEQQSLDLLQQLVVRLIVQHAALVAILTRLSMAQSIRAAITFNQWRKVRPGSNAKQQRKDAKQQYRLSSC